MTGYIIWSRRRRHTAAEDTGKHGKGHVGSKSSGKENDMEAGEERACEQRCPSPK